MQMLNWMNKSLLLVWVTSPWEIFSIKKLNFHIHFRKVVEKLSKKCGIGYQMRETLNITHLLAHIRSYVSAVVQYGVLLNSLGGKTMSQQNLVVQKKLVRIAFRLPYKSSVLGRFEECEICTVFEIHLYELPKTSLSQIRNTFEIPDVGSQQKDTRNREKTSGAMMQTKMYWIPAPSVWIILSGNGKSSLVIMKWMRWKMSSCEISNTKSKICIFSVTVNWLTIFLNLDHIIVAEPPNLYLTTQKIKL